MNPFKRYPKWLLIQVIFALIAAIVIFVVILEINPLIKKKNELENNIYELQVKITRLNGQVQNLEKQISNSRESVYFVKEGIDKFYARHYLAAADSYDKALRLDSQNGYILNLKGYALFKLKNYSEAENALRLSTMREPRYAWGYFDLARVQCAQEKFNEAFIASKAAITLRPELLTIMRSDGEFTSLCGKMLDSLTIY